MIKRTLNILWLSFVGILFLAAVATTALRLWVPTLVNYRHDIENRVSEYLGKEVTIGRLEVAWRGINPAIKLGDVQINNPGETAGLLDIEEIWIGIDVVHFLLERELRASAVGVAGADLTIVRDADGNLFIEGFRNEGSEFSFDEFFRIRRLSVADTNIVWEDQRPGVKPVRFSGTTFTLVNHDDYVSASGDTMLPADLGARVDFNAKIYAVENSFSDWNGRVYLKGESLLVPENLIHRISKSLSMSGNADLRLWVDFADAAIVKLTGEIQLDNFQVSNPVAGTHHHVEGLHGQLGWQRTETGWKFAINRFMESGARHMQQPINFSLERSRFDDKMYLSGRIPELLLEEVTAWLPLVPGLDKDSVALLSRHQPEGRVSHLAFMAVTRAEEAWLHELEAEFYGLGFESSDKLPAIKGLSGSISLTEGKGKVRLGSDRLELRADKILRHPVSLDSFSADITFTYSDNKLNIQSESVSLQNSDLALAGRFSLDLPADGSPVIDLELDVKRAALRRIPFYLPAKVMFERGVSWLDRSLVQGDVRNGTVLIQGPLDRLPYDKGEGKLEVRLPVTDVILDFNPDWTRIENLDAQVDFTGRRMEVNSRRGTIRSARLETVTAIIENLALPTLTLKGRVNGALPVMMAELGSSPLGERYGAFVDNVTTSGPAVLDLDILVPLVSSDDAPIEVDGNVGLSNNTLFINNSEYGLEKMTGNILFNDDGLSGKGLTATLFGKKALANVWTDTATGATHISLDGRLGLLEKLAGDNEMFSASVTGTTDWHILIGISELGHRSEIPRVALNIRSHLEGIEVELPAPFGKGAGEQRILLVNSADVTRTNKHFVFNYGDGVNGMLALTRNRNGLNLERGNIAVGGAEPALPEQKQLLVTGQLDQLSVTEWLAVLPDVSSGGLPVNLAISTDRLEVLGFETDDVTIKTGREGKVHYLELSGQGASGRVRLTTLDDKLEKVNVNLDHLRIKQKDTPEDREDGGLVDAPEDQFQPADFPALQVTIQQLSYGKADFGRFECQANRVGEAVHIERLVFDSELLALRASGDWYPDAGQPVSDFDVSVSGGKMGALLDVFGYQENVSGGRLYGDLKAGWPGAPWDVSPAKMEGNLKLIIKDGQLVDVEPGAGRLLGLLSLHTIQRRLSLDFSDIFKKGFSFDRIGGNFILKDGNAHTGDLNIEGPAARIEITGRIGLADEDYDQVVTIIPSVSSSIPIAGAIAGGPIVGAALLLAEKLLEKELEQVTRFSQQRYHVTGPWSEPVYKRIKRPARQTVKDEASDDFE
jgi:uncharacterized protein (TIGR02099 family)